MKKSFSFICLLPILLFSCNEEKGKLDPSKSFDLCRNGDLLVKKYQNPTYDDLGNGISSTCLEKSLEAGESITFIKTSKTCHTCQIFQETFVSFVEDYQLDVAVFSSNNQDMYQFRDKIRSLFDEDEIEEDEAHPFFKNTPSWYFASQKGKVRIANWGAETRKALERNYFSQASLTNIYKFSSLTYLKKALETNEDTLLYRLDYEDNLSFSFYQKSLFPLAKESTRPTYVLDMSRLNEEEKKEADTYFGEYDLIYKEEKKSVQDLSTTALLEKYY